MKKLKEEKGLTLVALIITIVVLLILAVVAIGAVQDSNIIGHAQNAAGSYNQAKGNEVDTLTKYEEEIEKYVPVSKEKEYKFTLNQLGDWTVYKTYQGFLFDSDTAWNFIGEDLSKNTDYIFNIGAEEALSLKSSNSDIYSMPKGYLTQGQVPEETKYLVVVEQIEEGLLIYFRTKESDSAVSENPTRDDQITYEDFIELYGDVEFTFEKVNETIKKTERYNINSINNNGSSVINFSRSSNWYTRKN